MVEPLINPGMRDPQRHHVGRSRGQHAIAGNFPPSVFGQSARNRSAGDAAKSGRPRRVRYASAGVPAAGSDPRQSRSAASSLRWQAAAMLRSSCGSHRRSCPIALATASASAFRSLTGCAEQQRAPVPTRPDRKRAGIIARGAAPSPRSGIASQPKAERNVGCG
jgi:hypothetical protein